MADEPESAPTKLDRAYQFELLNELARCYPRPGFDMLYRLQEAETEKYLVNIAYLAEHGLVDKWGEFSVDMQPIFVPPTLTYKGMDFLADDGGLSAIFGVATIRIHGDTIKELLDAWIEASAASQADKRRLKSALQSLPAAATKHLAMKLMDMGIAAAPATILWLETWLHSQLS
ncbi:MAG: hypothetical protein LBH31_00615 [Burkholderiaceae bacterium]|jgi:hypothetical protein|nr:hypothetical protein [Burkholderiaceae bacterium]